MIPLIEDIYLIIQINISKCILHILNSSPRESTKAKELFWFMMKFENLIPYICLGNAIWMLFIYDITRNGFRNYFGNIRIIQHFWFSGIKNTSFFEIFSRIMLFSFLSQLFLKKETTIPKKRKNIFKQISNLIRNSPISNKLVI